MPRYTIGETPFSIVYGAKAVLPAKIRIEIVWVSTYIPKKNESARAKELDLVKEKRMQAFYWMEHYRTQVSRAYNKWVIPRSFQIEDLILWRVMPEGSRGKLGPKWEKSFHIVHWRD